MCMCVCVCVVVSACVCCFLCGQASACCFVRHCRHLQAGPDTQGGEADELRSHFTESEHLCYRNKDESHILTSLLQYLGVKYPMVLRI